MLLHLTHRPSISTAMYALGPTSKRLGTHRNPPRTPITGSRSSLLRTRISSRLGAQRRTIFPTSIQHTCPQTTPASAPILLRQARASSTLLFVTYGSGAVSLIFSVSPALASRRHWLLVNASRVWSTGISGRSAAVCRTRLQGGIDSRVSGCDCVIGAHRNSRLELGLTE